MKQANREPYDILYARLSQEDEREGESNSIQNQRMILEQYAGEKGFTNPYFLYDDGFSGTNFNRPGWNSVMRLIESGMVRTLIVKDLSRLGREYLEVGKLTELVFPSYGVRFIAINDNVPFPVSWTVKMKKKQKETQDILSYHSQAAGCSDKARAKASGGRQPIEECGRTGL